MINVTKIINDTKEVFFKSEIQKLKYAGLKKFIDTSDYSALHKNFLTPLDVKIDVEQFHQEIQKYDMYFEQWGTEHTHLPRQGLALVNQDGILKINDPINGSLYEWNKRFPNLPIIESDCVTPTEVLSIDSLKPLNVFSGYWFRSNILKWKTGAEFKPHIDTILPSPWLRLWGTTNTDNLEIRYWNNKKQEMETVKNLEAGRIYIIDTSIVHDARSIGDVYQFFLSVNTDCLEKIQSLITTH